MYQGASAGAIPTMIADCTACHQPNLKGLPGVFPPLVSDSPILDDLNAMALVVVNGIHNKSRNACAQFDFRGDIEIVDLVNYIGSINGIKNSFTLDDIDRIRRIREAVPFSSKKSVLELAKRIPQASNKVDPIAVDENQIMDTIKDLEAIKPDVKYIGHVVADNDESFTVYLHTDGFPILKSLKVTREDPAYQALKKELQSTIAIDNTFFITEVPSVLKNRKFEPVAVGNGQHR
jgi:nitrite reductase (NO-forming)